MLQILSLIDRVRRYNCVIGKLSAILEIKVSFSVFILSFKNIVIEIVRSKKLKINRF